MVLGTYRVPYAKRDFEQDFTRAGIIQKRDELFEFRHPYVYYYFVARYFRDHLHKNETKRTVSELCDKLYIEEHSSIWLFLTHLSKDPFIVSCIAEHANAAFNNLNATELGADVAFIAALYEAVPKIVLEDMDYRKRKETRLQALDEEFFKDEDNSEEAGGKAISEGEGNKLLMDLNVALKTLDVMGQLLKNFPGFLEGADKYKIIKDSYDLGLRSVEVLLENLRAHADQLIQQIVALVREKHPEHESKSDIEKGVRRMIFIMTEMVCFGMIKRISRAVGHGDLSKTYDEILERDPTNAYKLIHLSIQLDNHGIQVPELDKWGGEFTNNIFCRRLLQHLFRQHIYMFPVKERVKQMVCAKLGMEIMSARAGEARSDGQQLLSGNRRNE
jgi:hypothetical protein